MCSQIMPAPTPHRFQSLDSPQCSDDQSYCNPTVTTSVVLHAQSTSLHRRRWRRLLGARRWRRRRSLLARREAGIERGGTRGPRGHAIVRGGRRHGALSIRMIRAAIGARRLLRRVSKDIVRGGVDAIDGSKRSSSLGQARRVGGVSRYSMHGFVLDLHRSLKRRGPTCRRSSNRSAAVARCIPHSCVVGGIGRCYSSCCSNRGSRFWGAPRRFGIVGVMSVVVGVGGVSA